MKLIDSDVSVSISLVKTDLNVPISNEKQFSSVLLIESLDI